MTKSISSVLKEFSAIEAIMEYKTIVENLTLAVFLVDDQLQLNYLNSAGEELLDTGVRRAQKRRITEFVQDVDGSFISHIERSIKMGHPIIERGIVIKRAGGSEVTIDCSITPLFSKDKVKECLLEVVQVDRMMRIAQEEHLLVEGQATQNMLRGLAHEIKNPLGGLRGAAQLLEGELPDENLKEYTDVIISEADRLRKLVDRMLGPNINPVKQQLNIHDVLEHLRHLSIAETPAGVNFKTDYDPSIPNINADRDLLVQAILNLVRNAVKAIGTNGNIVFRTRILRQFTIGDTCHRLVIKIGIIDDGVGIPEEISSQIFFPMVSGNEQGTGLGLPISQNIINLHGGLIEFDTAPGHTEFRVLLPIHNENKFSSSK